MTDERPIFFDQEHRTRCAISVARDMAASASVAAHRIAHLRRAERLAARLPGTEAERLLLVTI